MGNEYLMRLEQLFLFCLHAGSNVSVFNIETLPVRWCRSLWFISADRFMETPAAAAASLAKTLQQAGGAAAVRPDSRTFIAL